jgi:murein DD-endopeptidase MepM/ murein hydrolase activator NlpD
MKKVTLLLLAIILLNCNTNDDYKETQEGSIGNSNPNSTLDCEDATYDDWEDSNYVLPYSIGTSFAIGLSHCSGSYHSFGQPDQYAIDFNMPIGTLIKASRPGTVVFVEESGEDYAFPNNKVIIEHTDGTFGQYMHLTKNGAQVSVGQSVSQGSNLGLGGATGLAGYPHLHFVVTEAGSWEYPYTSIPMNFKNTTENPRSVESGMTYEALPF